MKGVTAIDRILTSAAAKGNKFANVSGRRGRLMSQLTSLLFLSGVLAAPSFASNLLLNGEFATGLDEWQSSGTVEPLSGLAVVTDTGAPRSLLWQTASMPAGRFEVEFDFRNLLSDAVPPGTLLDSGFVSIYLFSDAQAFDPVLGTGFDTAINLLDLDAGGPFNVPTGASLVPPEPGSEFLRFNGFFENTGSLFFAIVFDLFDLNFVSGDSALALAAASVTRAGPAELDIARDGEFIRVSFEGALEISSTLDAGSWSPIPDAPNPTLIISPAPGRTLRFQASDAGGATGSIQTTEFLGLTRIDFTGVLEHSSAIGPPVWHALPGVQSPIFVTTPAAPERFFRAVPN